MNRNPQFDDQIRTVSTSGRCYDTLVELSDAYHKKHNSRDLLSSYDSYESIDQALEIQHMPGGTDFVVYQRGHPHASEEAEFDVIGIIGELNFPTASNLQRFSQKPFSFIQNIKLLGGSSAEFAAAMDAVASFHTYFEQNTNDEKILSYRVASCHGMDSISANNPLISPATSVLTEEQCAVPNGIDPAGMLKGFLERDKRFIFTWDNEVEFLSSKISSDKRNGFKYPTPISPGFFREGHIVRLALNMRSGVIKNDGKSLRRLLPILRSVTLLDKTGSIMLANLRAGSLARGNPIMNVANVGIRRPDKRRRDPIDSDEEESHPKSARMDTGDRDSMDE